MVFYLFALVPAWVEGAEYDSLRLNFPLERLADVLDERGWSDYCVARVPEGFLPELERCRPSVALALSGGGARGLAHVGVLQVLEAENIPVDLIVGTSMGAITGGLYGIGYSSYELHRMATTFDWSGFFSDAPSRRSLFLAQKEAANKEVLTIRFRDWRPYIPNALITGETLFLQILRLNLDAPFSSVGGSFASMRTPVGIVATDLVTSNLVYMDGGDLPLALRASMAVPIVFRPLRYRGQFLVDGGAYENIPVRSARAAGADVIIAVDCVSPRVPELSPDSPWDIANQVTTLMTLNNDSLSRSIADIVITPDLADYSSTDFGYAEEIVDAGRREAERLLPSILGLVEPDLDRPKLIIDVKRVVLGDLSGSRRELAIRETAIRMMGIAPRSNSTEEVNQGLERLLRYLRRQGYGAARIKADLRDDGTLFIAVDPGVVREIRVEGVPENHIAMVMRDVRVKPGLPLRSRDLMKTLVQLHATGRYTTVYSYFERHEGEGVILNFLLEEAPFPKLGLGLGFDSDRGSRYFAELALQGLLRQGEELHLWAAYGQRDQDYEVSFRTDRLARTYIGWRASAGWREHERDLFNQEGEVVRVAEIQSFDAEANALFNLRTWGTLSLGLMSERVDDDLSGIWNRDFLNAVTMRAAVDTEDRHPFPRSGMRVDARYDFYLSQLGSERSFNRFDLHAEVVTPVIPRYVIRLAVVSGLADLTTPSSHRFSIGGIEGFPSLMTDRFIALRHISGTGELRFDLISRIIADAYLLARYDITAFSDQKDWRPRRDDFVQSIAFGVALDTLLGPMELWYAYTPYSATLPEEYRVALNIGYRF